MLSQLKKTLAIIFATTIAMKLFVHGLSYPLQFRVNGDALEYLRIAEGLTDISTIASYSGARTIGFPLFEKAIYFLISTYTESVFVLTWINSIGLVILSMHIIASWLFATWAQQNSFIQRENTRLLLFCFLSTFPVLVGHTTAPVSDTLSVDLILFGLVFLDRSMRNINLIFRIFLGFCSAFAFGYAVLVRPASVIGLTVALLIFGLVSLRGSHYSRLTFSVVAIGFVIVLTPSIINCSKKFGSYCLQSPQTFNVILSSHVGLSGARVLWTQPTEFPGSLPILSDEKMINDFYRRCHIKSIIGFNETSFTGCLLQNPLALPSFLAKKWIGLFDYFRFTPYLERVTPSWLRQLSRIYSAFVWIGFSICIAATLQLTNRATWTTVKNNLIRNPGILLLTVYSVILLAQHTVLLTEERYGFPLIPLCTAIVFMYSEKLFLHFRTYKPWQILGVTLFCSLTLALFFFQIAEWDNSSYFAFK